jgi:hypothetical protein
MVIVASIYLRFYLDVGVGTFLPTLTPPKIPSDYDSTALDITLGKEYMYLIKAILLGHY